MASSVDTPELSPTALATRVFALMAVGSLGDFQQVVSS